MSKYFEVINEYYKLKLWSKAWVWDAIKYRWLTINEYASITKDEFSTERPIE